MIPWPREPNPARSAHRSTPGHRIREGQGFRARWSPRGSASTSTGALRPRLRAGRIPVRTPRDVLKIGHSECPGGGLRTPERAREPWPSYRIRRNRRSEGGIVFEACRTGRFGAGSRRFDAETGPPKNSLWPIFSTSTPFRLPEDTLCPIFSTFCASGSGPGRRAAAGGCILARCGPRLRARARARPKLALAGGWNHGKRASVVEARLRWRQIPPIGRESPPAAPRAAIRSATELHLGFQPTVANTRSGERVSGPEGDRRPAGARWRTGAPLRLRRGLGNRAATCRKAALKGLWTFMPIGPLPHSSSTSGFALRNLHKSPDTTLAGEFVREHLAPGARPRGTAIGAGFVRLHPGRAHIGPASPSGGFAPRPAPPGRVCRPSSGRSRRAGVPPCAGAPSAGGRRLGGLDGRRRRPGRGSKYELQGHGQKRWEFPNVFVHGAAGSERARQIRRSEACRFSCTQPVPRPKTKI